MSKSGSQLIGSPDRYLLGRRRSRTTASQISCFEAIFVTSSFSEL